MSSKQDRYCPDCRVPAHEIKLSNVARLLFPRLTYSLAGGRPSFWTSRYPVEGTVSAFLCDHCGRIAAMATRRTKPIPLPTIPTL